MGVVFWDSGTCSYKIDSGCDLYELWCLVTEESYIKVRGNVLSHPDLIPKGFKNI